MQVVEAGSDDSFSDDESPKKRRDLLTRRPSYRKIFNELGGGDIAGMPNIIINCIKINIYRVEKNVTILLQVTTKIK